MYKVYARLDGDKITELNSDAFLTDFNGWVEIDEGEGDNYHHAQGNYFPDGLFTEDGIACYNYIDGEIYERTVEDIEEERQARPPYIPPVTAEDKLEMMTPLVRVMMISQPAEVVIPLVSFFKPWVEGPWVLGDNLTYEGHPYKVSSGHDSTGNPGWVPGVEATAALFIPWHGVSPETALPWLAPTAAHDIYKAGEWMIWADGSKWKCLADTNFSPEEYPQAWGQEGEIPPEEEIPEVNEYPAWIQPPNESPFMKNDKVSHIGKNWHSIADNNVWAPGTYGWEEDIL